MFWPCCNLGLFRLNFYEDMSRVTCPDYPFFYMFFGEPAVHFSQFFPLLPLTEVRPRPSAIPGGNPSGDGQSAVGWGDAGFEPRTAGQQSGALPLSHHASPPDYPVSDAISRMSALEQLSYPCCPFPASVLAVILWPSCPFFPILAVLSRLSFPGCPLNVLSAVLPQHPCPQPFYPTVLFLLALPIFPFLAFFFFLETSHMEKFNTP